MTVGNRSDAINDRLVHLIVDGLDGLLASPCTEESWREFPPGYYSGFGWRPPMLVSPASAGEAPTLTVPICPTLIDRQTSNLTDEDLEKYLMCVAFLATKTAELMADCTAIDADIIERLVWKAEDELEKTNPQAMAWLTETSLTFLDET